MAKIILIDASGSMSEEGKKSVLMYLIYTVKNILENEWSESDYSIFVWNNGLAEFEGKIDCNGRNSSKVLDQFLNDHNDSSILLISDGNFDNESVRSLKKYKGKIVGCIVGCDCNKIRFQKSIGVANLFDATDITNCVGRLFRFRS